MFVRRNRSTGLLTIMLLAGALIGGVLGQIFADYLPFLVLGQTVGFTPTTVNLGVLELTLGFGLQFTVAGALGLLLSYLLYRQL
jgi:hypothetical protein